VKPVEMNVRNTKWNIVRNAQNPVKNAQRNAGKWPLNILIKGLFNNNPYILVVFESCNYSLAPGAVFPINDLI
jgi:hypothetical protein